VTPESVENCRLGGSPVRCFQSFACDSSDRFSSAITSSPYGEKSSRRGIQIAPGHANTKAKRFCQVSYVDCNRTTARVTHLCKAGGRTPTTLRNSKREASTVSGAGLTSKFTTSIGLRSRTGLGSKEAVDEDAGAKDSRILAHVGGQLQPEWKVRADRHRDRQRGHTHCRPRRVHSRISSGR